MQANAGFHSRAIYIINCLNLVWGHFTKEIVRRYSFAAEARNRPSFPLVRPRFLLMQANAGFDPFPIYLTNCLNLVWDHFTKKRIVRRYSFAAEAKNRPAKHIKQFLLNQKRSLKVL